VRNTIAHEMIHGWAGGFTGAGQWASEGLTTYLTARTLLVLALQPIDAFVAELNRLARQYYGNPYRNASNDAAAAAFWADRNGEVLPYVRGALYFFDVNRQIRRASNGARSADDVLLELFRRRSAGETISGNTWKAALVKELGARAAADVDSIVVQGTKTLVLPPDAFAPCLTRRTTSVVVPDFAFDRRTPETHTVASLVPGSAASGAGLRDGDVITSPLAPEVLTSAEPSHLRLEIERAGRPLTIAYATRPKVVDSYQWSRAPGVADADCRR
jgi:predicted metalloprotease with PDZ domain